MKILFDEDAPRPLRRHLTGHEIKIFQEMRWAGIRNGTLLGLAEAQSFEVLLTFDQNMQHQQNMAWRVIAILVIVVPNKKMETILPLVPQIETTLSNIQPGQICVVAAP